MKLSQGTTLITNGQLVDGTADSEPVADATVVVTD